MTIKPKFVVVSLLVFLAGAAAIFYFSYWFDVKQDRVLMGLSNPNFPYPDYTTEELGKLYPQEPNEDVVTTQTPEQTHAKFIVALKAGDINGAVDCCVVKAKQGEMKTMMEGVKSRGQFELMVNDLVEIEPNLVFNTTASYVFSATSKGEKVAGIINFLKNSQGVWLIESF